MFDNRLIYDEYHRVSLLFLYIQGIANLKHVYADTHNSSLKYTIHFFHHMKKIYKCLIKVYTLPSSILKGGKIEKKLEC